jgi:hypothetical protein
MNCQEIMKCQIRPLNHNLLHRFQGGVKSIFGRKIVHFPNCLILLLLAENHSSEYPAQFVSISLWDSVKPQKIIGNFKIVFTIIFYLRISSLFINSQMWLLKRYNSLFCRLHWEKNCQTLVIWQDQDGHCRRFWCPQSFRTDWVSDLGHS